MMGVLLPITVHFGSTADARQKQKRLPDAFLLSDDFKNWVSSLAKSKVLSADVLEKQQADMQLIAGYHEQRNLLALAEYKKLLLRTAQRNRVMSSDELKKQLAVAQELIKLKKQALVEYKKRVLSLDVLKQYQAVLRIVSRANCALKKAGVAHEAVMLESDAKRRFATPAAQSQRGSDQLTDRSLELGDNDRCRDATFYSDWDAYTPGRR